MSIQVIDNPANLSLSGVVLSIGNFDGVHRGHQAIIAAGRLLAQATLAQVVAMTFEPHPAAILSPDRVPPVLTPLDEKIRLLETAGVDAVVVMASRPEFFSCLADRFIRDVILGWFKPVAMVEGASFRFGRHRLGDVETLRQAGLEHGFTVQVVPPVRADLGGHPDTVISSSLVRHLLASGNVDRAGVCLGRPYTLIGQVERGAMRGRTLGFATANLQVGRQLVPAEGVYAGVARVEGRPYPAAVSIGTTPTFGGGPQLIEAHLLNFGGELYGQTLRLDFIEWIRAQQKFDSPEALVRQIKSDVVRTRSAVSRHLPKAAE